MRLTETLSSVLEQNLVMLHARAHSLELFYAGKFHYVTSARDRIGQTFRFPYFI